ncbi:hypothetical protein ONS96_001691 [Cadophora gregata f. sp. sojae]|nr:hypothetical protein ONS96_001691 [Cadophora gregata f. sp. sojae]
MYFSTEYPMLWVCEELKVSTTSIETTALPKALWHSFTRLASYLLAFLAHSLTVVHVPMDPTGENVGHNVHTDYGTLTLVFAPQWGLQVFSPENKGNPDLEWEFVEPRPGCAIVNVADVLRFLTNDRLKSAVHRVLPLPDVDRYSTTYFLRPSDDLDFVDGDGNMTNVLDWYDRKNNMYEAPSTAQDRSLLVGGLYKEL